MRTFTDALDRKWTISVTVFSARKLKADAEVDIQGVLDGSVPALLVDDRVKLVEVLWVLCESQAEKQGIDPDGFAMGLVGDVLDAACDAVIEEMIDFFPTLKRQGLKRAWEQAKRVATEGIDTALRRIEEGGDFKAVPSDGSSIASSSPGSPG